MFVPSSFLRLYMSQDFVGQYITTINNGIAATFRLFNEHRYYDAAHSLLPVLSYTIISEQADEKEIDSLITEIEAIPGQARDKAEGSTEAEKEYQYERHLNGYAYDLYIKAIKVIKQSIKADILQRKGYNALVLQTLREGEFKEG
jgi:hypothetical protein